MHVVMMYMKQPTDTVRKMPRAVPFNSFTSMPVMSMISSATQMAYISVRNLDFAPPTTRA